MVPIAFCLQMIRQGNTKQYHWKFYARPIHKGEYEERPDSISGTAAWTDGFPLSYKVGADLSGFTRNQLQLCEEVIHNNLALYIPQMLLEAGYGNIVYTPTFPPYVGKGAIFRQALASRKANLPLFLSGKEK